MAAILMMSIKLATLGLLKLKVFHNKGYDVIISVLDFTNKNLSNHIVDVNHFHNISKLFDVLPNFSLTTSETMSDYYL